VKNAELVEGEAPVSDRHRPAVCGSHQRQVEDLCGGLIGGEPAFGFDGASQDTVDALDGVGGVDDPPDFWGVIEDGDDAFPIAFPGLHDRWEAAAVLLFELEQLEFGFIDRAARVYTLQGSGDGSRSRHAPHPQ